MIKSLSKFSRQVCVVSFISFGSGLAANVQGRICIGIVTMPSRISILFSATNWSDVWSQKVKAFTSLMLGISSHRRFRLAVVSRAHWICLYTKK